MQSEVGRRQFLTGDLRHAGRAVRPPWALAEAAFLQACTRCRECLSGCPQGVIVSGSGGFPEVDLLRGECTFCGDCLRVCAPGALDAGKRGPGHVPWDLKAEIGRSCFNYHGIACRVCADRCVARAIRFRPIRGGAFVPRLDRGVCNGCGACIAACPAGAVRPVHDSAASAEIENQEGLAR